MALFENKKRIRFVKEGTSPMIGNIWVNREITLPKKQADAFIGSGAAVEIPLETDPKEKKPGKAGSGDSGQKPDTAGEPDETPAGNGEAGTQADPHAESAQGTAGEGEKESETESDIEKNPGAGDDETETQADPAKTVKENAHGAGHKHGSKAASKGHKHR